MICFNLDTKHMKDVADGKDRGHGTLFWRQEVFRFFDACR